MEVLELKKVEDKKIIAYMNSKENAKYFQAEDTSKLVKFLREKEINFVTVDFQVDMNLFHKTPFAKALNDLKIPYFQLDIPDYAMGYLYEEIVEKQELQNELFEEYKNIDNKESYKGLSLKNWIDMLGEEIQQKEIYLSLTLRPQWIVKKMLDLVKNFHNQTVSFIHFIQEDICEDICHQVGQYLRNLDVKVVFYNKKHTILNEIF